MHEKPVWARQLGQSARARALAEFDERVIISRTMEVYDELIPQIPKKGAVPAGGGAPGPEPAQLAQ
jgi:hypothetical protein